MWLVAGSFLLPTLWIWASLRWEKRLAGPYVVLLVILLSLAPGVAGWMLHEASYAGNPAAYAALPWAGMLWGAAAVRIHDNRRLLASQQLIDLRIRKLERLEAELRVSTPAHGTPGGVLKG